MKYPNERFYLDYFEAEPLELKCIPPHDVEVVLKACKKHEVVPVYTLCDLDVVRMKFFCQKTNEDVGTYLDIEKTENYFCINDTDRRRLLERCTRQ